MPEGFAEQKSQSINFRKRFKANGAMFASQKFLMFQNINLIVIRISLILVNDMLEVNGWLKTEISSCRLSVMSLGL